MGRINSRTLFLTTSPRTPEKMIPEIDLLSREFTGQLWNYESQRGFMEMLREQDFFHGKGEKDPSFSARDRINRAPKALGFVRLKPTISLTPAGEKLIGGKRTDEVFLRQLMKFQIPSPYHKLSDRAANFCIKPYLELLRLVYTLGTLKFDELQIFGMQLTDWHDFDTIVDKIRQFRIAKTNNERSYRRFKAEYLHNELRLIYQHRISKGEVKTRESRITTTDNFLRTQSRNMRDYADACFRYLRATGLVNVSQVGKSLSIVPERGDEVAYILNTLERTPKTFDSEEEYCTYLGAATTPALLTDDKLLLARKISEEFPTHGFSPDASIEELKELLDDLRERRRENTLSKEILDIKNYKLYDDIQAVYSGILEKKYFDNPIMLEWNTWRAMTMIDGGKIKANLSFDDFGKPLSTAVGNMADIVCDYGDFLVTVEVTLSSGQKQFEMEGESVSRHLGNLKTKSGKPCYCLFIAPTINDSCVSYFYSLHKINLKNYGGRSTIVPLPLNLFCKMVEDSYNAAYTPSPSHIRAFFETSNTLSREADDEYEWYNGISHRALDWLSNT